MKKGILIACLSLVLLTGCGTESEKTMNCSRTVNQNGIKADLKYTVTYKGSDVVKVSSVEKMEVENEKDTELLDEMKKQVENLYANYSELDHYDVKVTVEDKVLTSKVDIDYSKIDTEKMIKIDSSNGQIIKDGKVNVDDLKKLYETQGVTCEK